jgi:hypothetical protein
MSRRCLPCGMLIILLVALALFFFSPWMTEISGRWHGEAVYQGQCTSSWRQELLHWKVVCSGGINAFTYRWRQRQHPPWDEWLGSVTGTHRSFFPLEKLPLLQGDVEAVPVLLELLKDPEPQIRLVAAEGLGAVGPPASVAVPHLFDALPDVDSDVHREIEDALFRIDIEAAHRAGLGHGRWWW